MAENKKSFVLYADLIHTVKKLPKEKAGELFLLILEYVNDENPSVSDPLVDIAFEPIRQTMKRDLKKWEKSISEKSIAGHMGNLKRWNPDLHEAVSGKVMELSQALVVAEHRRTSQTDRPRSQTSHPIANVAVSVSDSVTVNDNVSESKGGSHTLHADEHFERFKNSEETKVSFNRTLKGIFPVFTKGQLESVITGYLGYFDGKYPEGEKWGTFTKAFQWYVSDLKKLPEAIKPVKNLGA